MSKSPSVVVRLLHWLHDLGAPRSATVAELDSIRRKMSEQVLDCDLRRARRVRAHLDAGTTAMQLWLTRSEIYQVVADEHGQHEAAQRVKKLTPLFKGLISAKQLKHAHNGLQLGRQSLQN